MRTTSTSTSDLASMRHLFKEVARRPEMFGVDRRYAVLTAFVMGCDEAGGRHLLHGFQEWLLARHRPGTRSSLGWDALLADLVGPSSANENGRHTSYRDLGEDESEPLAKFMFDELDRFLESRMAATNGGHA